MLKFPLGSDDRYFLLVPRGAELGVVAQVLLHLVALLVPLVLLICLYRYELRLRSRWHAVGLLTLRLGLFLIIAMFVLLQPQVVAVATRETPGMVRIAVDISTSMEVADPQRSADELAELERVIKWPTSATAPTRKQVIARLLGSDGAALLSRLCGTHEVELVAFDERGDVTVETTHFEKLGDKKPREPISTDLGAAMMDGAPGKPPLLGIVLLSDGQHNVGPAPFERAKALGRHRIPIFPIVIGSRTPPSDVMIAHVDAPTQADKGATMPITIRVKATNLAAQPISVELQFDGKDVQPGHRETIKHDGVEQDHTVTFQAKIDDLGVHPYRIKATSQGQEITLENNVATRFVRVATDKVKILLVDGETRWEHHYLANALMRDPKMEVERVVFTQPHIGAIKEPELAKLGFAKTKLPEWTPEKKTPDPLNDFDVIVLGDVAPEQLPVAERRRLEQYVSKRGGALILLAGKRHLPMDYLKLQDDPLTALIPVIEPRILDADVGFRMQLTSIGKLQRFLHLEPDKSASPWPELQPHFWGVEGKRRPGGTVWLSALPKDETAFAKKDPERGMVVQQPYGLGQVVYIGIDSTWRWRFRVGDTYHHRFWGQLLHWASEKRLPAGNRFVRYGPREPVYLEGEEIKIAARFSGEAPPIPEGAKVHAKIYRRSDGKTEELVDRVELSAKAGQPNLREAKPKSLRPGIYRVELDVPSHAEQIAAPPEEGDAAVQDGDVFRVLPRENAEMLDLSTNEPLLLTLAQQSGGAVFQLSELDALLERLAKRVERSHEVTAFKPWETSPLVGWTLGLLLTLLTVEWGWRKWLALP